MTNFACSLVFMLMPTAGQVACYDMLPVPVASQVESSVAQWYQMAPAGLQIKEECTDGTCGPAVRTDTAPSVNNNQGSAGKSAGKQYTKAASGYWRRTLFGRRVWVSTGRTTTSYNRSGG